MLLKYLTIKWVPYYRRIRPYTYSSFNIILKLITQTVSYFILTQIFQKVKIYYFFFFQFSFLFEKSGMGTPVSPDTGVTMLIWTTRGSHINPVCV